MLYYRASLDKSGRTINCSERSTVEEENRLMSTLTNEPVESTKINFSELAKLKFVLWQLSFSPFDIYCMQELEYLLVLITNY